MLLTFQIVLVFAVIISFIMSIGGEKPDERVRGAAMFIASLTAMTLTLFYL